MRFLVRFCGYSAAESDNVRRGIAKKKGTETLLPEIERRFTEHCGAEFGMSPEQCERIIKPFLQVILDASSYAFSWNHSDSYSAVGYICGYLRYYHPLEFLTASLNTFGDDSDKTAQITKYAQKVGIRITMPKFGVSRSKYFYDADKRVIAKGLSSVKYMSEAVSEALYDLGRSKKYERFVDLLADIDRETSMATTTLRLRWTGRSVVRPHCGRDAAKRQRKSPASVSHACSPHRLTPAGISRERSDGATMRSSAFSRRARRNAHHSPASGTAATSTRNIGFANLIFAFLAYYIKLRSPSPARKRRGGRPTRMDATGVCRARPSLRRRAHPGTSRLSGSA